ncbi:hypothetical protein HYX19_00705 [Candidatus Woesearchaeota archaeon]|nr:hypothetical protein [Candidatus Woesearchaeota archaeon]
MSGIPTVNLSAEDQKRIYRDLFREKPVPVKVDPREEDLEDRLKQKEAIEEKHRRRNNLGAGVCFGSLLIFFGSIGFGLSYNEFAPYRKDPMVVEYLGKKLLLMYYRDKKDKILSDPDYNLEKDLDDGAKRQSDIKEREGKKEVAAYNYFLYKSQFFFLPGILIGGSGVIGSLIYGCKNYKNKERELKALGF